MPPQADAFSLGSGGVLQLLAWKVEMTQRSMCLLLFPAHWQADRYAGTTRRDETRIVVLASLQFSQQLPDCRLHLGQFRDEGVAVHLS
jgi:hypothetical protein